MKRISIVALAVVLAAAAVSTSQSVAADPPPEKSTLVKKLFGPRPAGPTVRGGTPGKPITVSAPLPADQLAEALRAEQDAYLRRSSVCTELRRIAVERGDDTMVRQIDEMERQAGALYNARVAGLGVSRAKAPLPEPSMAANSPATSTDARLAASRLLAPNAPVPGTTTAQVREVKP
jgi:hypothetical protein